ncbi:MAG: radical SAM protein [Kiritimatiellae bacterium]|nr:radical SAM protein [Kiritimatiellia bacterium]
MKRATTETAFAEDPFGELSGTQKVPGLVQRFPDRVLVVTTDRCFSRCPHCTRRWILGRAPTVDAAEDLARCVAYVRRHPKVRDVLLSGGDVLTLPDARVAALVDAFAALPQVEVVRVCTRAPVSRPERVTERLARLLAKSGKVWANVHVNTAAEAAAARGAAARLVARGIPVSSQTVLLKGVNDTPRKMLALLRALSAARIRPYYVFMCDPVAGLERFRVPLERAVEIERYCAARIGGLALPRFVADVPGADRKIPIETLTR